VLPQSRTGEIRFRKGEDVNPSFINEFSRAVPDNPNITFICHRDKIKLIKHERAKLQNLEGRHGWKLQRSIQHEAKYSKGLNAQLNRER